MGEVSPYYRVLDTAGLERSSRTDFNRLERLRGLSHCLVDHIVTDVVAPRRVSQGLLRTQRSEFVLLLGLYVIAAMQENGGDQVRGEKHRSHRIPSVFRH